MTPRKWTAALLAPFALAAGCDSGEKVKPVDIEIKVAMTPLDQAISFLDRYAKGQPMGSEATQFDDIVKAIREQDPVKADLLKAGFDKMKTASPAQSKAQAAALVKQVSPNNAPPPPK